ncbi:Retinoic acid induced 16-like protein [Niveomyces insectorum RCEF 264]|uniref:Retinoic acid induced 16-like protein n=1 Tax=Niveomyces insectorum RCEF 264 TaxID=1081102 RepID=A0A167PCX1_9HYPO|nr:Retinoic acid induced 16-like protein [Niveomyces insectorum RCEF 264]
MDFWSRLLSHTPLSAGTSRKDVAKDPVRRRHRFEKEYAQLLQTWRNSSNLVHDIGAADTIELRIQELTDILIDESRRPLPHTCLHFASERQIYVPIGKIATTSYNLYIIKEAVYFFGTLIESEDDAFVENETFASSLTNLLVRITGANSIRLDSETETKVVELAFNITTKIRLQADILPAWFKARQTQQQQDEAANGGRDRESESHERFKGKTQRQDFPLFYILMDYIHSEGKVGDFARTGLLYIIESASAAASASLEQWIVESDLSTLMATGLGALYSQLSRKLVIDHPPANLPPILAMSDYEHPRPVFEVVNSCSPDFQVQLDTFLSHLLFWQDVLNHCRSVEVKSTLLEHFQVIFLQQLLYPSLLESSDIDGGSSVAVLTYLRRILESVDHPDMINLILHYLLALPDAANAQPSASKNAVSAARKRKSMDLATMMAAKVEIAATPLLFNLVDLILACLKSHSQQTIYVTLQLVSVVLRRHHRYALMTLVRTGPVLGVSARRTIGAHQQELEYFMSMSGVIGGQDNFDEVYDTVLKDMVVRLESHPCSLKLIAPKVSTNNHELPAIPDSLPGAPRDVLPHTIRPDDPLLTTILDRLETFFVNPVETNLSVTEALIDLGTCGFVSLEGWLLRHPDTYAFDGDDDEDEDEDEDDDDDILEPPHTRSPPSDPLGADQDDVPSRELQTAASLQKCRRRPRWSDLPRLLTVLHTLAEQVVAFRDSIPRFDDLLQQRREAFQTADTAAPPITSRQPNALAAIPATPSMDRTSLDDPRSGSPARPSALEGFAQRILSELGTPSRTGSPRGRKDSSNRGLPVTPLHSGNGNHNNNATMSGGYGLATPTATKSVPVAPKEFPLNVDNMAATKVGVGRSFSPGSYGGRDNMVASQFAAYQAVDRQILARRVGLPSTTSTVEPIPLNFNKQPASVASRDEAASTTHGDNSETGSSTLPSENGDAVAASEEKTVTVSHVLTNTVVLQFFLFEIGALLQARAGLFDEVRFI